MILIDEHLPLKLANKLCIVFPGIAHVLEHRLGNSNDKIIWQFAKQHGYTILTKDKDFKMMSVLYGCPPKVIQLRCGNKSTDYMILLLESRVDAITAFVDSTDCYLEIL